LIETEAAAAKIQHARVREIHRAREPVAHGGRQAPLADILPGSQVAVGISAQPSVVVTPSTSLGSTSSISYPSALPREMVAPIESPQVHVIVLP